MISFKTAALAATSVILSMQAMPASADVPVPPFYQALTKLKPEGPLGQILAKEEVATQISGAKAWRIAYISSDAQDRRTISTGLVVTPTGAAPDGGRSIVTWAHGTTGTAQNCGPSQMLDPAQPLNEYFLIGGDSSTDYGLPAVDEFIKQGYVVVGTDYQGLGGGGKHQYVVATANARDTIDAARAAASMPEAQAGRKTVIYGWSQGGGAALAASTMPDYIGQKGTAADDLDIVGIVALAPDDVSTLAPTTPLDDAAAEKMVSSMATDFSNNVFNFTHFSMFMWGMVAAVPGLELTDIFTPDGAKVIDEVMSKKCVHAAADTLNYNFGDKYTSLMNPKIANTRAWAEALLKTSTAAIKPIAPVIIYWGTKDTTNPPVMGQIYRERKCALGGNVTRFQLPGEQTHFTTPGSSQPFYVPWVQDRFDGKPLEDGCAAQ